VIVRKILIVIVIGIVRKILIVIVIAIVRKILIVAVIGIVHKKGKAKDPTNLNKFPYIISKNVPPHYAQ